MSKFQIGLCPSCKAALILKHHDKLNDQAAQTATNVVNIGLIVLKPTTLAIWLIFGSPKFEKKNMTTFEIGFDEDCKTLQHLIRICQFYTNFQSGK
jgi:hypothetical protein